MRIFTLSTLFLVHFLTHLQAQQMVEMSLKELEKKGYVVKEYSQEEFDALQRAELAKKEREETLKREAMIQAIPKEEPYVVLKDSSEANKTEKQALHVNHFEEIVIKEPQMAEEPKALPIKVKSLSEILSDGIQNYSHLSNDDLKSLKTQIMERVSQANMGKKIDMQAIKSMPMTKANLQELLIIVNELKL